MSLSLCIYMYQETERVNNITDQYLDLVIKNSWFVGCAQGTKDFKACHKLSNQMDWNKLSPDIKRISK